MYNDDVGTFYYLSNVSHKAIQSLNSYHFKNALGIIDWSSSAFNKTIKCHQINSPNEWIIRRVQLNYNKK